MKTFRYKLDKALAEAKPPTLAERHEDDLGAFLVEDEEPEQEPDFQMPPAWIDPRIGSAGKQVIVQNAERMGSRCKRMAPYDACIQWLDVFLGNDLDADLFQGNGDHFWIAVDGGIFDPRGDQVDGYPALASGSYNADRVIWKNNERVDHEVLSEMPEESPDLVSRIAAGNR